MTGAASTSPPAMPRPLRMLRRETFSTLMRRSMPRSFPGFVMMFMIKPLSKRDGPRFRCVGNSRSGRCCRHRFAYLIMCGFRVFHQQRRGLHDLAGLAIAALRDIHLAPCLLNRMITRGMQTFDRRDFPVDDVGHRGDAGADGLF